MTATTTTTAPEETTATTAPEDTRCVLVYRDMIEQEDGRYELSEATVLGDEEGGHVAEWCVCASPQHALDVFIDNLTTEGALGHDSCSEESAEDVTESEGYMGWGTVVRHSWVTLDDEHQSCLYSVTTMPADEWIADIEAQEE